tara:strand:+ start:4656 stop:5960 length:1305 start_codon:yes stop_codon:yes gene_type:complete
MPTYESAAHLQTIAHKLEAVERGEIKRLIVLAPPRHGKSEIISKRFPCWYLGRHPTSFIVQVGYSEAIALVHSRQARDIFVTSEMAQVFPEVQYRPERAGQEIIIPQRQAAHEWGTQQRGSYYAVGIGGSLTGRGFDIGIIDDPVKDAEEAGSAVIRDRIWDWYRTVFRTRANPDAAIIVIMTRWHQDDLVGRLLNQSREDRGSDIWEILSLEAIDNAGKALWGTRYPIEVLDRIKASIGSRAFTSLYQGNPVAAEGNIIKREWWKYYKVRSEYTRLVQSWDTAFKAGQANDYSVCTLWGESNSHFDLIDVWRERVEFPEMERAVIAAYDRDKPSVVLIEDAASGQSLIQTLKKETRLPIKPVKADKDKVARANAVTPLIEAGRVRLPERASWLHNFVEEVSAFPSGEHDDQVDTMTQALNYMAGRPEKQVLFV